MNRSVRNAAWIVGCRIVQSALSFIVSLMSARYLGPSNYGVIQYASSLVAFITPLMTLGFTNILVHELISNEKDEGEVLGTAILTCLGTSIVCIVGIALFNVVANPGDMTTIIVCGLFSVNLFFSAIEMTQYWFQAKLLSKYTSIISLIAYICISAFRIHLLIAGKSVYWFAAAYTLDELFIAFSLLFVYKYLGGQKFRPSLDRAKAMFTKSRYYIVSSLMVSVMAQIDRIMLKQMMDDAATGFYSAAVACAGITSFIFAAIADSFRPIIFESRKIDYDRYLLNIKRLYSVMIYLSLVQCIGLTVLSDFVIYITYGPQYSVSASALRIVVWYTTFSYLGIVRNIWILAESKQKYLWIINVAGAAGNVVLNSIMIPVWGINGAALASLLTQIFANFVMGYILKPIRENNRLMLQALNPRLLVEMVKHFKW